MNFLEKTVSQMKEDVKRYKEAGLSKEEAALLLNKKYGDSKFFDDFINTSEGFSFMPSYYSSFPCYSLITTTSEICDELAKCEKEMSKIFESFFTEEKKESKQSEKIEKKEKCDKNNFLEAMEEILNSVCESLKDINDSKSEDSENKKYECKCCDDKTCECKSKETSVKNEEPNVFTNHTEEELEDGRKIVTDHFEEEFEDGCKRATYRSEEELEDGRKRVTEEKTEAKRNAPNSMHYTTTRKTYFC